MDKALEFVDGTRDAMMLATAMAQSAESAETLETVMKRVQSTVKTTTKQVRKFVADFDELQRLPEKEITVTSTVKNDYVQMADGVTDGSIAYDIRKLTGEMGEMFSKLRQQMHATNTVLGTTHAGLQALQQEIQLNGNGFQNFLLPPLERTRQIMNGLAEPTARVLRLMQEQTNVMERFSTLVTQTLPGLQNLETGLKSFGQQGMLDGVRGRWCEHWDVMAKAVRRSANEIIGYYNGLMAASARTVNAVGWISSKLPGSTYRPVTVTAPKIPALAQGAVLPANQPFLAVVGDQRHGTNIEAPLATIQEAVSVVTADQTGAIVAGFEASVGVQKEILEAVLGISIGDDTIANACHRYEQKMAVVKGG